MNLQKPMRLLFRHLIRWVSGAAAILSAGVVLGEEMQSGAKPPERIALIERSEDLRAFLASELAAGKKRIVIPMGRYRVKADRGSHLVFSNLSGVEIIAENVELVCTSTVRALSFVNCVNVILRGLKIDYDPLPFTQGRIVAMAPDKSWLEFEVAEGYPEDRLNDPVQIFDPASNKLRRWDTQWDKELKALGNRRHRVSKAEGYRFDASEDTEQIGDILVARNIYGKSGSPHAIELQGCKGMRFEDITLFASPSFGFLERSCEGTTYLRCIVDRRDPADDPVKRAVPRIRSLNADAFHSKEATRGPAILSCTARYMGDDAVNINGRYHYVREAKAREVRIAILDEESSLRVGDPVEFIPYSGPRPPDAKIVEMHPDPLPLGDKEKSFVRSLRMDERMRTSLLAGEAEFYTIILDRAVPLSPGSALCCPLRLGHGFVVKDCHFGHNRSRGILIKASKGEVSGNRITNSRMAAILISPEFWWMEAGMSSHVIVRENHIQGCMQTPIQVHARGGNRDFLPAGALRNISILKNRIESSAWPLIHVTSTSALTIKDNILPSASSQPQATEPILLEQCETR